ncbi:hypothetical protein [Wolbachia endosymbiont of Litomosoides brasiliensis]|uniref:hypothetical protein n=1 Tax=Wolbachia endosymbiont of Litomosoides brasiliensis TaxID=1812117 RepID=UPI001FE8BE35|nr:hypothetical protein [Wolbachia endosymbiont of Litomosoides brasiliensis]
MRSEKNQGKTSLEKFDYACEGYSWKQYAKELFCPPYNKLIKMYREIIRKDTSPQFARNGVVPVAPFPVNQHPLPHHSNTFFSCHPVPRHWGPVFHNH